MVLVLIAVVIMLFAWSGQALGREVPWKGYAKDEPLITSNNKLIGVLTQYNSLNCTGASMVSPFPFALDRCVPYAAMDANATGTVTVGGTTLTSVAVAAFLHCNNETDGDFSVALLGNLTCSTPISNSLSDVCFSDNNSTGVPGEQSFSFACGILQERCSPQKNLPKNQCQRRVKTCSSRGIQMKWTGKGCVNRKTKRRSSDGGCQCKGYCGFTCREACRKDRECYWNGTDKACWTKATQNTSAAPGTAINSCPSVT